nr:MAG TPA: hypothetical protein [Caudoviricetes sp.]
MIIRIEKLQNACKNILTAVDSNTLSTITETLELVTVDNYLYMNVTNREYFAQVKIDIGEVVDFHATVNATLFLKLISQITTDTVELNIKDNYVVVVANGTYKLPLIFDGDKLLELPEIEIKNVTNEFEIDSDILTSILQYNSKELLKGTIARPVQRLYYVDEKGAITFTSGACVNSFNLPQEVKLLFNDRLVKLFKLFDGSKVNLKIGYDNISEDIIQTKVSFTSTDIKLTAILSCDDSLLSKVPVSAIRGIATAEYPYSININKEYLLQAISRLLLFNTLSGSRDIVKPYSILEFGKDSVIIYDVKKENKEVVNYNNTVLDIDEPYTAILDLPELKATLETCNEPYLNINFGNNTSIVLTRGRITNVIPECVVD